MRIVESYKKIPKRNKERLVNSAYEDDITSFMVFVYNQWKYYTYYIPDEIRKSIKKILRFWLEFKKIIDEGGEANEWGK